MFYQIYEFIINQLLPFLEISIIIRVTITLHTSVNKMYTFHFYCFHYGALLIS